MPVPVPVDQLQARKRESFPVKPGTNEAEALRFLAANPEYGWPPKKIARLTSVSEKSITKTTARLYEKGLVERESGYYFVPQKRLKEIQGYLGDLHNVEELAGEKHQVSVHPESRIEGSQETPEPATESELDDLVDSIANESGVDSAE